MLLQGLLQVLDAALAAVASGRTQAGALLAATFAAAATSVFSQWLTLPQADRLQLEKQVRQLAKALEAAPLDAPAEAFQVELDLLGGCGMLLLPSCALIGHAARQRYCKAALRALLSTKARRGLRLEHPAPSAADGAARSRCEQALSHAAQQLQAMSIVIELAEELSPEAQRDVARACPPRRFLDWLSDATALLATTSERGGKFRGAKLDLLVRVWCCVMPVNSPLAPHHPLAPAYEAVQQDKALQQRLVQLVMRHALREAGAAAGCLPRPRGAPDAELDGWRYLAMAVSLLIDPAVHQGLEAYLHSSEAMAALRLVVRLVDGLPVEQPALPAGDAPMQPAEYTTLQAYAGELLAYFQQALTTCECCRQRLGSQLQEEQEQEAAWLMLGLVPKVAELLPAFVAASTAAAALAPAAAVAGGRAPVPPAASHAAAGAGAGSAPAPRKPQLSTVLNFCNVWSVALELGARVSSVTTADQLLSWCRAAEAGLRTLPLLHTLCKLCDQPERQAELRHADAVVRRAPRQLAAVLAAIWHLVAAHALSLAADWGATHRQAQGAAAAVPSARAPAPGGDEAHLLQPLLRVHAANCRLLHWVLAMSSEERRHLPEAIQGPSAPLFATVMAHYALHPFLTPPAQNSAGVAEAAAAAAAVDACPAGLEGAEQRRHSGAAAAAQIEAMLAAQQAAIEFVDLGLATLTYFVRALAAAPPACITPEATALLHTMLQRAVQVSQGEPDLPAGFLDSGLELLNEMAACLPASPHLVAAMVGAQSIPLLLRLATQLLDKLRQEQQGAVQDKATHLFSMLILAINRLQLHASDVASSGASGGAGSSQTTAPAGSSEPLPSAEARQLLTSLGVAAVQLGRVTNQVMTAHQCTAQGVSTHLQAAGGVASLLQAYWALPEQQAAARLELAQVAVTRSCAYLRCADLARPGHLAGEGKGSLKCSGCRTAWYCSTACSHADWRAGHKRVCKALAALRQQEQQNNQQVGQAGANPTG